MYCNNCGKFLLESDKFCSNCGAMVLQNQQNTVKDNPPENVAPDSSEVQTPKITPPVDSIKWNIADFPGHDVKKTEEINFDWGNNNDFKKPEPTAEEIALNPVQKPGSSNPTEGGFIAPPEPVEEIIQGKDLEEEIFAEASLVETIHAGGDPHKKTKIVDKFYTFNKKNEEFQKLLDKEYEKIKTGESDSFDEQNFRDRVTEINQQSDELWPEFNPTEHIAEMALARERFFGPMEDPYVEAKKPEPPVEEEPTPVAEEPKAETEPTPTVEEPAFEEQPEAADEPVAVEEPPTEDEFSPVEDTEVAPEEEPVTVGCRSTLEPIDQPGEEPLPENNILPDLEICNMEQATPAMAEPVIHTIPEPVLDQTAPLEDKVIAEDFEDPKAEELIDKEPEAEALKDKVPKADDDVLSIRDKWIKYEEEQDEEEEKHSSGKVGKFIIGLLILILLTQGALLGIRWLAPDSAVAQFVDKKVQQVILFFQGDDNKSLNIPTDRSVAAEDKTSLIQLQIDKNYNENIGIIKYNSTLLWNSGKKYSDTQLNKSVLLEDNKWYTKSNGTIVYYDESAVGAIISYESTRRLAKGETFATLEIGETRISGENLYVWVAETITPGDRQEKIFRIKVSGETMNVDTEYDV
jgi:hypothetical protein